MIIVYVYAVIRAQLRRSSIGGIQPVGCSLSRTAESMDTGYGIAALCYQYALHFQGGSIGSVNIEFGLACPRELIPAAKARCYLQHMPRYGIFQAHD